MNGSLSYRTKRRRIANELLALESTDDDNVFNTQTIPTTCSVSNSTLPSHINFDDNLNTSQLLLLNSPFNDQNPNDSTASIPTGDFIKNINFNQEQNIKDGLRKWATDYNIPQNALNALLNVLKCDAGLNFLPKDSRTLLQCKSTKVTNMRNVEPRGYYYHFGLSAGIMKCSFLFPLTNIIKIAVGVDGLPLSASSSSQFWPILAYIMPHHEHVFPIGIYYGQEKPNNSDEFLKDFISEVILLSTNGITINGSKKNIVIEVICCDAPARAFLLKVKSHSGFFSCTRCTVEGDYLQNRVCFPYLPNGSTLRTHDDYVSMKYEEHHTCDIISCISSIPNVDVVQLFSMDYMNLVCLGVMRKLIHIWMGNTKGPKNVRIPSWKINQISNALHGIKKNHITKDFSRKPRALVEINRWKATELRQFLLYTGIIVLKNVLSDGCYQNFLVLCISMRILLNTYHQQYVNYAQK